MGNTYRAKERSNNNNNNNNNNNTNNSQNDAKKAGTPTKKKKPPKAKYYLKLLLVGTSSCGKSTLAKQMKILHCDDFTEEERSNYRKILIFNMCCAMKELIAKAPECNFVIENELLAQNVSQLDPFAQQLTMKNINDIKKLWEEKAIQATFGRRNELDLPTNIEYCLSRAHSLIDPQHQITHEDILRARQRTTGIAETEFQIGKFTWNLIDVGGQRAERRKWVHYYEGAVAIMYVASLDDFDVVLPEDPMKTRMEESIEVFDSMINHEWFSCTPWILFLNKKDLFRTKIQTTDMKKTFSDYQGGENYDQGVKYIERLYLKSLKSRDPQTLFVHVTCALDTQQVKFVFDSVSEWIFKQRVIMSGIS